MKKGWEIKKLEEVCEVLDSKRKPITEKDRISGEYPYYGATGILGYVHEYIFDETLILIGEDGAKWKSGDRTAFLAEGKYWVNNHAHVIRPNRKTVLDNWIIYFLNFSDLSPFITGLTVPKLNQAKMRGIELPIPPFSEQENLVSILDEVFVSIEQAKDNLQRNLQNAKDLLQSEKNQVFENLEKEEGKVPIASVCNEIFAGGDAPKENFSDEKTEKYSIPIFANAVGKQGLYGFTDVSRVTEPSITIAGRGSGTGYTEVRYEPFFPIVRLIVLTPNTSKISLEFLKYAIQSLTILKSGSAIPQLTIPMIKGYSLPLPSLSKQEIIVEQLDTLSTETKNLENIYLQKLKGLEELKKSILQKAFSGELKTATVATA